MNIEFSSETAMQLFISFIIGTAIGIEREYRSKAAGLRTMIMICLGSTLFTEISLAIGGSSTDRIASNIITGIGFLGAGVIFKDGLTITGITTATTIWITAALGMAVGAGEYFIALVGSIVVLVVLLLFEKIQLLIARSHQQRIYKIIFQDPATFLPSFESEIKKLHLHCRKERDMRDLDQYILLYAIYGSEKNLEGLNAFLKTSSQVRTFEY
jgi:putative Mg2+ transporter-C (MgtC) family protein